MYFIYFYHRDAVSRLYYYLQLRENVLNYGQAISEEAAARLVAFALQSDVGNQNEQPGLCYDHSSYLSPWVSNSSHISFHG